MEPDLELQVPGARLRYRESGTGPAVVLIHGWTLDLEMWDPQVADLAGSFRTIRFDRRGFGLSSGRPSLLDDVADVLALCTHLSVERVCVVGMSQAARVAVRLARIAPQLVRSFVLHGAPPAVAGEALGGSGGAAGSATSGDVPLAEYRRLVQEDGVEAFRKAWSRHPLARLQTSDRAMHELLSRMIARYRADDLREIAASPSGGWDPAPLESLHQPALVIAGALDIPTRRAAAQKIARRLPNAELRLVPAAGHLANLDNPPAYNAALLEFLKR